MLYRSLSTAIQQVLRPNIRDYDSPFVSKLGLLYRSRRLEYSFGVGVAVPVVAEQVGFSDDIDLSRGIWLITPRRS